MNMRRCFAKNDLFVLAFGATDFDEFANGFFEMFHEYHQLLIKLDLLCAESLFLGVHFLANRALIAKIGLLRLFLVVHFTARGFRVTPEVSRAHLSTQLGTDFSAVAHGMCRTTRFTLGFHDFVLCVLFARRTIGIASFRKLHDGWVTLGAF